MAQARGASVPLLVRRTGVDLEFVVAHGAIDVGPVLIATEFAARMPIHKAHFPAVIVRSRRRGHHFGGSGIGVSVQILTY
jgi:hypothetical protein